MEPTIALVHSCLDSYLLPDLIKYVEQYAWEFKGVLKESYKGYADIEFQNIQALTAVQYDNGDLTNEIVIHDISGIHLYCMRTKQWSRVLELPISLSVFAMISWREDISNSLTVVCASDQPCMLLRLSNKFRYFEEIISVNTIGCITTMAKMPYRPIVATGGEDYEVKIFDLDLKQCIASYQHGDWVRKVAWIKDPITAVPVLLSASDDGTLVEWRGGLTWKTLIKHEGWNLSFSASADTHTLLIPTDHPANLLMYKWINDNYTLYASIPSEEPWDLCHYLSSGQWITIGENLTVWDEMKPTVVSDLPKQVLLSSRFVDEYFVFITDNTVYIWK